jgi:hypothetical protein
MTPSGIPVQVTAVVDVNDELVASVAAALDHGYEQRAEGDGSTMEDYARDALGVIFSAAVGSTLQLRVHLDPPSTVDVADVADELAAGVRSFLSSLAFMAPEAVELQARVKLAEPLAGYDAIVHP